MYISTLPWIFNMVLVATIILLAGEIVVARKDERDTHSRMLELFGENDKERKKKRLLKQKIWARELLKVSAPQKVLSERMHTYLPTWRQRQVALKISIRGRIVWVARI